MATGMNVPVKAGKSGGVEFLRETRQKAKILRLALSAGDDKNPFQSLGIGERALFQIPDAAAAADLKREVQRILKKFQGSIALKGNTDVQIIKDPQKGFGVRFEWVDLDKNEPNEFLEFVNGPGSGG